MSLVSPTSPDDEKKARMSELGKMMRGGFWFRKWSLVDMTTLCWMVGIHVLAASALFVFDWGAFIVAIGLAFWTGIGITLGFFTPHTYGIQVHLQCYSITMEAFRTWLGE
nr:fatty acid desaturase, type 1 [Tanacetum cinerariifolium]